jgi:Na+/phosphate symporter
MKIIDKTLIPYQQKLADAMEDLVQMVAQTYDGFMKHKKPPLAEAEKIGKRIHDFERGFAQALCKEGDKVGAVTLLSLAGHVERIGSSLEGVIRTVHSKINEGTLFSDKAVSELTYVYNTVKDMTRNTKDVVLTLNSFLADYVKAEGEKLSERAMEFTTAHEERMISGVCQPVHSAMYLQMVDNLRTAGWHLREIVSKLQG